MKVADYLKEIGLYQQVVNGIQKIFRTNTDLIQFTIGKLEDCNLIFTDRSSNIAGSCTGISKIKLHESVAKRPEDRNSTMLHEVGHLIRNCKLNYYGESDGGGVRFQYVSRGGFTGLRKVSSKRRSPHGNEWKAIMVAIGGNPKRCHNYTYLAENKGGYKHKYVCADCGHEILKMRKLKNLHLRYHSGCKRKPNGGKLIHTQLR